jgi:hypothetical protein
MPPASNPGPSSIVIIGLQLSCVSVSRSVASQNCTKVAKSSNPPANLTGRGILGKDGVIVGRGTKDRL